jgi:hypothetical protein
MKAAALPFQVVLALVSGVASVQAAGGATPQLRDCPLMESAEGLECRDKSPRATSAPLRMALAGDGWTVSETTSPIDYSPIATATTLSRDGAGTSALRLSIRCRGGRTELAVSGGAITGRGDAYSISYRVNGGQSVQSAGVAPAFGDGVAFKDDAVALLQSLPTEGDLVVEVMPLRGSAQQGIFSLNGLETLRAKIGATCKWPHVIANPTNR